MQTIGVYWPGEVNRCAVCQKRLTDEFIDGDTVRGVWCTMHVSCHAIFGRGLGIGRGQKYRKQEDGRWKRVEG